MSQSTQVLSSIPWRSIADHIWDGKTVQESCKLVRIEYKDVLWHLNSETEIKSYLVDVSMIANVREEILNGFKSNERDNQ